MRPIQWSLLRRATLPLVAMVVVMAAMLLLNLLQFRAIEDNLVGTIPTSSARVDRVHQMQDDFLTFDDKANLWVSLSSYGLRSAYAETTLAQALAADRQLDLTMKELTRQSLTKPEVTLLAQLSSQVAAYERIWSEAQRVAYTNPAQAAALMHVGTQQVGNRVRQGVARLNVLIDRTAQAAAANMLDTLALEAFLVLVLGALAVLSVRRAVAPVPRLVRTLEEMASGNFDELEQVEVVPRSGEITRLASATNVLGLYLRRAQAEQDARARDLERLVKFNALLAEVIHIAAYAGDETAMLHDVSDLAVRKAGLGLVWVGVPDEGGLVRITAAAGLTDYVAALPLSVNPDIPGGQRGLVGRAWHEGVAQYVASIAEHPDTGSWREWAKVAHLTGVAVIPLERGGARWGLLSFYLSGGNGFDPDIRLLLEELARTVSRGLDRLDANGQAQAFARTQGVLLDQAYAGIALGRERVLILANRHLVDMLGYEKAEDLVGKSARILYATDADYERVGEVFRALTVDSVGRVGNVRLVRRDGQELIGDIAMNLVREEGVETVVWTVQDVTERFNLERDLEKQAYHDELTGLPNRRALDLELSRAVEFARRRGTSLVVGVLDLDDFKTVNDALGHEGGDRVLREFAARLTDQMRSSDFVARPGGDEFVVLLEDFDLPFSTDVLEAAVSRLHRIVETPLEPSPGELFSLDLSLGLAVFPGDGEYGADLLRTADRVLYDLKAHKRDRSRWWQLAADPQEPTPDLVTKVEAYDEAAKDLLNSVQGVFGAVAADFVEQFYRRLGGDPDAADILSNLGAEALERLKAAQAEHMVFLLSPATTQEELQARARHLGEIHSVVGVDSGLFTRSVALYRELLAERLNQTLLSSRQRYRILLVVERRLQDDMNSELQGMHRVTTAYLDVLSRPLPDRATRWADASQTEIESLGQLPGMAIALLLRLDFDGQLTVERSAGPVSEMAHRMLQGSLAHSFGKLSGATLQALRKGQILSSARFVDDARFSTWSDGAHKMGIQSMLAIPVLDAEGHVVAGICLYGRYRNQFESPAMHQFAQAEVRRWEELWRKSALPAGTVVLSEDVADSYRELLFAGGLQMFVQPMVDLRGGRLLKVEALARLKQTDGRIVSPAVFLPLLGEVELARLFRLGLNQALGYANRWLADGIEVDVSVNLAPSTLLHAECERWVADALSHHGVVPDHLTLEVLETTLVDEAAQDAAIGRLVAVGVRLAIDDLGSAYSSLQRLSALPFHEIKIDQGLLRHLRDEPLLTFVVLDALIEIGRRLGRDVVVEGLEDRGAIEVAGLLGATLGQGYGLARPMPAEDLASWMAGFTLPIDPGKAHTYLGAMAHHWKYGHAMPRARCPMTGLLAEKGLQESEAAHWHEQAHTRRAPARAIKRLTSWLLDQVRDEGMATR